MHNEAIERVLEAMLPLVDEAVVETAFPWPLTTFPLEEPDEAELTPLLELLA